MHYLGFLGVPRRYYAMGQTEFLIDSVQPLNVSITVAALIVSVFQLLFIFNLIWSLRNGKPSGSNPWRATSLEWQTPQTPPVHGNWGPMLPVVHRWAYDYGVPGADEISFHRTNHPTKPPVKRMKPATSMGSHT